MIMSHLNLKGFDMSERGIRRPKDFQSLIEGSLIKSKDSDLGAPFDTYAEIMSFVAVIGANLCQEKNFKDDYEDYGDPIKFEIFKHKDLDEIINTLAVYKTKDLNVLTSEGEQKKDEKISIFEGYAYAGLKKLQSVLDRPGMTLDNLVDFIKEHIEETEEDQKEEIVQPLLLSSP